jgi:excisionase family DNA binding protein
MAAPNEIKIAPESIRRPFYTVRSLVQLLALSERTVREMVRRGVVSSYRVEGARRFAPEDVDSYLAERRDEREAR